MNIKSNTESAFILLNTPRKRHTFFKYFTKKKKNSGTLLIFSEKLYNEDNFIYICTYINNTFRF